MVDKKRTRIKQDTQGFQVKGKTTRKLIDNDRKGTVDWRNEPDRSVGRDRKF